MVFNGKHIIAFRQSVPESRPSALPAFPWCWPDIAQQKIMAGGSKTHRTHPAWEQKL